MLVVIDVGNTNITIGIYHGDKLIGNYRLTTKMKRTSDEYGFMMMNFLNASKVQPEDIQDVIVSSVVPKIMHSFLNGIRKYICTGSRSLSGREFVPVSLSRRKIQRRSVPIVSWMLPEPIMNMEVRVWLSIMVQQPPSIMWMATVILSTASSRWELKPVHRRCGHRLPSFPEIEIKKPASILAKTTTTSMQAGLVYGYIGQSEYIIKEFKKALNVDEGHRNRRSGKKSYIRIQMR